MLKVVWWQGEVLRGDGCYDTASKAAAFIKLLLYYSETHVSSHFSFFLPAVVEEQQTPGCVFKPLALSVKIVAAHFEVDAAQLGVICLCNDSSDPTPPTPCHFP